MGVAGPGTSVRFIVTAGSEAEERGTRLAIEGLRAFGGPLRDCPVWAFGPRSENVAVDGVQAFPLEVDDRLAGYPFAAKVTACARAEDMARDDAVSLAFLSGACLVLAPPVLLRLTRPHAAALRPVHIRNVGLAAAEPVDGFWRAVYDRVGDADVPFTVDSLVDEEVLRPYFNTHLFSVDSTEGLFERWLEHFAAMATDADFQSGPCGDAEHRVFLHQAILSALVARVVGPGRLLLLPREYSYPLHFHSDVPKKLRAASLEELVCPVYEGAYAHPATLGGIAVGGPLDSWLAERSEH